MPFKVMPIQLVSVIYKCLSSSPWAISLCQIICFSSKERGSFSFGSAVYHAERGLFCFNPCCFFIRTCDPCTLTNSVHLGLTIRTYRQCAWAHNVYRISDTCLLPCNDSSHWLLFLPRFENESLCLSDWTRNHRLTCSQ
jgi:hypothetical protein